MSAGAESGAFFKLSCSHQWIPPPEFWREGTRKKTRIESTPRAFIQSNFFSALQSYCSRFSVSLLLYDSRSTLLQLDHWKKIGQEIVIHNIAISCIYLSTLRLIIYPSKFFLQSGRNRVNLVLYESKQTDKRKQYDWKAEKTLEG